MRVRYDEDAREELRSAVRWYEEERAGLGARFHASVMATERLIAGAPSFHSITDRVGDSLIRRALIPEFPYGLAIGRNGPGVSRKSHVEHPPSQSASPRQPRSRPGHRAAF